MSNYKHARDRLLKAGLNEKKPEEYPAYLDGIFDMYNAVIKLERMNERERETDLSKCNA